MKHSTQCPECKEVVEGIDWEGGYVIVFDHKKPIDGKWHHYRLTIEIDRVDRRHRNEEFNHPDRRNM